VSKKVPVKRFEELLRELEAIVGSLENDELELEDALRAFERGMELSKECHKRLDEAERKVELLQKRSDGEIEAVPFVETDEDKADDAF
jgi:exodeoxyribonuclease VII small subunit